MGLLTTASRPRSDSRGRPASLPKAASRSWVFAFLRGGSTESEFRQMLHAAGFRLDRVIDIGLKTSILEAEAA